MKNNYYSNRASQRGFSLVEILVAVAISGVLVIGISQLFCASLLAMNGSGKHMSADGEVRQIFNRMEVDFSGMLKRNDVDYIFYKPELSGTGSTGGSNDSIFFYSQAPAYFSSSDSSASTPIALLGYRIDNNSSDNNYQQLERLGQGLTWDNSSSTTGGLLFLGWNPTTGFGGSSSGSFLSTWSAIGQAPYSVPSTLTANPSSFKASYEVMGDQIFRFEYCFLLKDGSYSDYPVMSVAPAGWNSSTSNYTFFNSTNTWPTPGNGESSSGTSGFAPGSRWYNTKTGEAFICTNASPNNAVWSGVGVQDISAIIVTLGVLDNSSRKLIPSSSLAPDIDKLTSDFADSGLGAPNTVQNPSPNLPATTWNTFVANNISNMGVPQQVAGNIRVYQRAFYITQSQGE